MNPPPDYVAEVAKRWGLRGEVHFLRKVENFVYDADEDGAIVRLTEPGKRSLGQLNAELEWMAFLQDRGIRLANPRPSQAGHVVEAVNHGGLLFHCVVFEKVHGRRVSTPEEHTPELFQRWGETLGRMHAATLSYRPSGERRPDWHAESGYLDAVAAMNRVDAELEARGAFEDLVGSLEAMPRTKTNYGLIHADLHPGNFFVSGDGELVAFDFDDCQYHWLEYDLAVPLFLVLLHWHNRGKAGAWEYAWPHLAEGYARGRPSARLEEERVMHFFRLRTAVMFHWCKARLAAGDLDDAGRAWADKCIDFARDRMR